MYFENTKYVVKLNDNIIDLSKLSTLLAHGDTISIERTVPDNKLEMFWKIFWKFGRRNLQARA